jgi:hypothetical protein
MIDSLSEMVLSYIFTFPEMPYIAIGLFNYSSIEPSINNYDKTGLFSIGFKMFLFGFTLVFLVFFFSNLEFNGEPSVESTAKCRVKSNATIQNNSILEDGRDTSPISLSSNAKRILLSIGAIVAILGLIISIVRWMTIDKI